MLYYVFAWAAIILLWSVCTYVTGALLIDKFFQTKLKFLKLISYEEK